MQRQDPFRPRRASGAWQVDAGRVLRLRPREDAHLRACRGSLWVTFDAEPSGALDESGDHFIHAGQKIAVKAGQVVVISPAGPRGSDAAFDWEMARPATVRRRAPWREVLQRLWDGLDLVPSPAR
jgi:hypothetical protein